MKARVRYELLWPIIKMILPRAVLGKLLNFFSRLAAMKARRIFEQAEKTPAWLEWEKLEFLQKKYHYAPLALYDPKSVDKRGRERASEIFDLIETKAGKAKSFLELGCQDGMVSSALHRLGKTTIAIDIKREGFDERAIDQSVTFL